jgi:hypothetical protein
MAKVKLKAPFAEISGKWGDFYFRKGKKEGEAVLAVCPRKPRKPSKAQRAQWDRLRTAVAYARAAKKDPEIWAYYQAEAERLGRQPHLLARADYLNGKNLFAKK